MNTPRGARRAADGHPAPFKLRYVEIGNEDFFEGGHGYDRRFPLFYDAIKAKYPQLKLIATSRDLHARTPDLFDDHIYADPKTMARAGALYDHYDRRSPKVFVGEWATQNGSPTPTLRGALGDAAYLTGLERNADVIEIASYAPLFTSVLPDGSQWPTNLTGYDALNCFGSTSYYVQVMFSANKGDVVLPTEIRPSDPEEARVDVPHGGVGFGTYETPAEFKDVRVTQGTTTLLAGDFEARLDDWQTPRGHWSAADGSYRQSDDDHLARVLKERERLDELYLLAQGAKAEWQGRISGLLPRSG